jgi:glutamyl-tRNA synthetase
MLDTLDDYLAFRTFFVGHSLSSVDLAVWGACKGIESTTSSVLPLSLITGSGQVLGILKRNQHPHLSRWYNYVDKLHSFQQVLTSINTAKQKKVCHLISSINVV